MISNLKLARQHAGYTQKEAVAASGYSLGQIRNWEQGVTEPDSVALVRLANLYHCSTDTILGTWAADLESIGVAVEPTVKLGSDEVELVELYRKLSDDQRAIIVSMAKALVA